jgi:hypothetical protein
MMEATDPWVGSSEPDELLVVEFEARGAAIPPC